MKTSFNRLSHRTVLRQSVCRRKGDGTVPWFSVWLAFLSYGFMAVSVFLLPVSGSVLELSAGEWWSVLLFQPFHVLLTLVLGSLSVLSFRFSYRLYKTVKEGGHTAFRKRKGPKATALFLYAWMFLLLFLFHPWFVGTLFSLFWISDAARFFSYRRQQHRLKRNLARETSAS